MTSNHFYTSRSIISLSFVINCTQIVLLDGDRLDMFTHWVVHVPQSEEPVIYLLIFFHFSSVTQHYDAWVIN